MKNYLSLLAILAFIAAGCGQKSANTSDLINPIIGNASYEAAFGTHPTATTSDQIRIETHLSFVEELLRSRDVSHLSPEKAQNREQILDLLHEYIAAGQFPKNYDFPGERRPCFIDKDNSICAVGYLVEKTAGMEFAEYINERFQYAYIEEMDVPQLAEWANNNGLTVEECATIQPTYGGPPYYYTPSITPSHGVATATLSGLNLSVSIVNATQFSKYPNSRAVPITGMLTGAAQATLGAVKFRHTNKAYHADEGNRAQQTLALINIGMGTSALVTSGFNLISNKKPRKEKTFSWNIHGYPTSENDVAVTLNLTKTF